MANHLVRGFHPHDFDKKKLLPSFGPCGKKESMHRNWNMSMNDNMILFKGLNLWLLVIENELNGCRWRFLYFATWPAICVPKHFLKWQFVHNMSALMSTLKNNLNLCYCGGKPRSCDSSIVLWSLFCVSSMYGFKKKTMSFPLRTCPALAASKSQFFSSPASAQRLAPSSPHGKLPNSDLTKTSGWARPNWCCAAAASAALFSSYLFIFLREFHQKLGDRWIFDLMRDIRERTTQQRQGDVFLSPNSLNWKVDMHPSFTVVFSIPMWRLNPSSNDSHLQVTLVVSHSALKPRDNFESILLLDLE